MFRNCLAATFRNLARNKLYAAIKILGLSVGFAAAILIALFVRDEFSYDKWIPGYDRVVRLSQRQAIPGQAPFLSEVTWANLAGWLTLDDPGMEAIARVSMKGVSVKHGDIENYEGPVFWADPDIFDVLPLKAVTGDLRSALKTADGIVLTRSEARKYFGRDDPIGETLELGRAYQMRVTAVIEDLPSNTHLNAKMFLSGLASFSRLSELDKITTFSASRLAPQDVYTYIRLKPGVSIEDVRQALRRAVDKNLGFEIQGIKISSFISFDAVPLAALHLRPAGDGAMKPSGDINVIWAVAAVGVLIVLVAAINFVNLMTARAARRAVEVGVRKVAGAARRDLIVQFFAELLIYTSFGIVIAVAMVELALPSFNAFMDRTVRFAYWRDPELMLGIPGLGLVIGLLAGAYPALVLSSFRPIVVLKGYTAGNSGTGLLRQMLVVIQFAVLIGLVLATITVYRQTIFATRERLHFAQDQTVEIPGGCNRAFKQSVLSVPGVLAAACSDGGSVNRGGEGDTIAFLADGTQMLFHNNAVAPGFFELYGVQPIAGRVFSEDHGGDVADYPDDATSNPPVVLNETAARQLGFAPIEGAVGANVIWIRTTARTDGTDKILDKLPSEVIGVVPDFSLHSARELIQPTIYYYDPRRFSINNVKLRRDEIADALRGIRALWDKTNHRGPLSYQFIDQQTQAVYADVIRQGIAFEVFAGIAVFVAVLGLFGLSAFTAEQRTKEIGIRKAMGASTGDIIGLLLWQFSKPVLWANLLAWPIAGFAMSRRLHGFAYHVDIEPWTFAAAGTLALAIALATVVTHSFLVARAKPVSALRYE